MQIVRDLIAKNPDLQNFKFIIKIFKCLKKDHLISFYGNNPIGPIELNEHISGNDHNISINIFADCTTYASCTIRNLPYPLKNDINEYDSKSDEQKVYEALRHFNEQGNE